MPNPPCCISSKEANVKTPMVQIRIICLYKEGRQTVQNKDDLDYGGKKTESSIFRKLFK